MKNIILTIVAAISLSLACNDTDTNDNETNDENANTMTESTKNENNAPSVSEVSNTPDKSELEKAEEFLEANKKNEGVIVTESGLQYIILKDAEGPKPGPTDKVKTHYHGTYLDGRVFDSSVDKNEPIVFAVNGVIAGWTEALQLMSVGAKYKLFVHPTLAYGERGHPAGIPPNAALIFEVELLAINP